MSTSISVQLAPPSAVTRIKPPCPTTRPFWESAKCTSCNMLPMPFSSRTSCCWCHFASAVACANKNTTPIVSVRRVIIVLRMVISPIFSWAAIESRPYKFSSVCALSQRARFETAQTRFVLRPSYVLQTSLKQTETHRKSDALSLQLPLNKLDRFVPHKVR